MEPERSQPVGGRRRVKKVKSGRKLNTAIYMVRCMGLGLSTADLKELTYGMVTDMFIESAIDSREAKEEQERNTVEATQADFDRF